MSAQRGVELAADWYDGDRAWLRALAATAPAEAVLVLELVGTFDATIVKDTD